MSDISAIAKTVSDLAAPGMTAKDLLKEVRKRHPEASKKQVTRAAFYAVIVGAEQGSQETGNIHGMAISTRNSLQSDPKD